MAKTKKSPFANPAVKKAYNKHRSDETKYSGGGELPAGINNGLAKLTRCDFGQYKSGDNQGEWYFIAMGSCIEPKEHEGVRCEGLNTMIMEPLCETPNRARESYEDHLEWILNELRKLGVDTEDTDFEDLEEVMKSLVEEGTYLRFNTWSSESNGKTYLNQKWDGAVEDYDHEEEEDVVDETEDEEVEEPEEEQVEEEPEEDVEETDDWEALGEAADQDDEEAQIAITEKAEELGLDTDDFVTWADVVLEFAEEGEEEEEEVLEPSVKDLVYYKPARAKKKVECEVQKVNKTQQTCKLLNLDADTTYDGVPWSKLSDEE